MTLGVGKGAYFSCVRSSKVTAYFNMEEAAARRKLREPIQRADYTVLRLLSSKVRARNSSTAKDSGYRFIDARKDNLNTFPIPCCQRRIILQR